MSGKFICKISFFYFYSLNVNISLTMHDANLELRMCIKNIVVEGTVSQIFDRDPGSFFIKSRKKYSIKKEKVTRFLT